jgi:hypothetical protein
MVRAATSVGIVSPRKQKKENNREKVGNGSNGRKEKK